MYQACKRAVDIAVSLVLIITFSPVLIVVATVLRFTGEGEILYIQRRIGLKNKKFGIYKFATMLKNSPNMGNKSITVRNDPRVLPVGKFLRMTKLNELPQLFNVLFGDMSLVGPRPFVDETFAAYPEHIQQRVYDCKPGLTGIGSIVFRDEEGIISASSLEPAETYRQVIAPHKGELELWYQQHQSLWTDFVLLALTAAAVAIPNASELPYRIFSGIPERPDFLDDGGVGAVAEVPASEFG